jgi:hypothetical protein
MAKGTNRSSRTPSGLDVCSSRVRTTATEHTPTKNPQNAAKEKNAVRRPREDARFVPYLLRELACVWLYSPPSAVSLRVTAEDSKWGIRGRSPQESG